MQGFIYVPTEIRGCDPVHGAWINVDHIVKIVIHDPQYLEIRVSDGSTLRVEEEEAVKHILTVLQDGGSRLRSELVSRARDSAAGIRAERPFAACFRAFLDIQYL